MRRLLVSAIIMGFCGFLHAGQSAENLIAPYPAEALLSHGVIKGTLTTNGQFRHGATAVTRGQKCYKVKLKPNQSVMATVRAARSNDFRVSFADRLINAYRDGRVQRIGNKCFYINGNHQEEEIVLVVHGQESMTDAPYELIRFAAQTPPFRAGSSRAFILA